MPSGRTHLRIELFLFPVALLAFWYWAFPWLDPRYQWQAFSLFGGAYLMSSLLFSPDLDLRHNSARNNWGVLGFVWIPYTKIFKHRGLSHSLIFGVLTRLAYLSVFGALIGISIWVGLSYLFRRELAIPQWQMDAYGYRWLIIFISGLWVPNVIHILVDRVHSAFRRRKA